MNQKQKSQTKLAHILGYIVSLVITVVIMTLIYRHFAPQAVEGTKSVTINVVSSQGETTSYPIMTDATTLHEAIDDVADLTYEGDDSDYGLMIHTINGETADYNTNGSYWAFYVNDEYCNYGIDEQPVNDGDVFSIVYTTD